MQKNDLHSRQRLTWLIWQTDTVERQISDEATSEVSYNFPRRTVSDSVCFSKLQFAEKATPMYFLKVSTSNYLSWFTKHHKQWSSTKYKSVYTHVYIFLHQHWERIRRYSYSCSHHQCWHSCVDRRERYWHTHPHLSIVRKHITIHSSH